MNVTNMKEWKLNKTDAQAEKRVVLKRSDVELMLRIEEARAILGRK